MQSYPPELLKLQEDIEKLKKSSFTLDSKFLNSFFDPIPKSIAKYVFLLFIVFTLTNIMAAFVLVIYYFLGPRKTKHSRPRQDSARNWFMYAERCLKYSFRDEIKEGYTRALELEPENGQIQLRYNQYLVTEQVHNKVPATGQPVGIKKTKVEKNPYDSFKSLLVEWRSSHPDELFPNPIKPQKNEKIFTLATWSAFDNKRYNDCISFGEYSLKIQELGNSKKDREEKAELLLLLACSQILQKNISLGIDYTTQAIVIAGKLEKPLQAMTWELLGECFHQDKRDATAEQCYLQAQKKDIKRWISAYRLFRWYTKQNDFKKSSLYKSRYIRMQKELSPL